MEKNYRVIFKCYNQTECMSGQKKDKKTFSYLDWVEYSIQFFLKYDKKGCPKFRMATYTKEIIIIK